ncbi:MAG: phenylalanine--tRNA ligase subunit beta, partial [Planctomycetes bacterium]|nr:phenylalanine--tRNA ligase subunit beta [Planctomycetota bacterium]
MKATYRWIKEYVPDYGGSVQEMCDAFTMSGTEVEFYRALDDDDWMIEFTVTSNRVDCNGVIGLARELSAVTGHPLVLPSVELSEGRAPVEAAGSVEVLDPTRCSRFTARVLEGVEVGPSPGWLKSRIESIGLRSVNNVVDATNFAMFETNQPFHAFDLRALPEGKIIVRKARAGETLVA